ncbi:MAG TPA: NAD(P)/FAD-dependent oxidoreductase [Candidatus Limnocylindria bacterium]|nr:NAD(P)/FAD-dependent oxidoreductase [Candidatus Limnocylindria bacterium]
MPLRTVVVGAGMSGILSAIKLAEAGLDDVVVYEKAGRVGGTWRENTYPGVTCDVPSHFYSYSFAPNPDWSHRFAPGAEIQAYFEDVARRYDVPARIRFGTEITRCERAGGRWRLRTAAGPLDEADVVIAATGVLHHPKYPDIPGLETFGGPAFHSARWDHAVPLADKRVGVVGTGSSAVQITGALVDRVAELVLFQRTAQWIAPAENPAYTDAEKAAFRAHPETIDALRAQIAQALTDGFANHLSDADSPQLRAIHDLCVAHLESKVTDPVLRERLRPTYRAACKRLIMSDNFYDAIQRPNARLVTEGIERIEPDGVRTRDARLHRLDVLVLATGFGVDRFVRPMTVIGRDGLALDDVWRDGPFAYMAIAVPDFPNFFMLNGPNSPVGNFSLIEVAELQIAYILQLVALLRAGTCTEVSPTAAAMRRFDAERREAATRTIWASGCRSWYLDASGLPSAWPWSFDRFRTEMAAPRLADFELR